MDTFLNNTTGILGEFQLANSTTDDIEQFCISILLACCLPATCINCVVIISVYWITNSMSPNLKISISLAIADVLSSSMSGLMFLMDKMDPDQRGIFPCLFELIRVTGIVITVLHLLALSFNHYIGILKPLHYNVIVTKRKVTTVITCLWVSPVVFVVVLSAVENNGVFLEKLVDNVCVGLFTTFTVRLSYSASIFFPVILMVFCYSHILVAVRKQRNKWKDLSRSGSSRAKGRNVNSQKVTREQARLQDSIKAINTTLMILGSCFVGWLPGLLMFILMCEDCPIDGDALITINAEYKYEIMLLRLIENMLIIMKMFANPIIYTIRIKEIRDSTNRMYLAVAGFFCPWRRPNTSYGLASSHRSSRNHASGQSMQIRMNSLRTSGTESYII